MEYPGRVPVVPVILVCCLLSVSLFAQTDQCMAHFEVSGSIRKGIILETYDEFSGVDVETALRRLQAQLPSDVTVLSVDAENAIVRVENKSPGSRPFPMQFTFTPSPSGTRVQFWTQLRSGMSIVDGTKPAICSIVRLANREPPPRVPSPAPKPSSPARTSQPALSNEEVMKLVAADLGDEIVIARIKNAAVAHLDVSTDALVALKDKKVSKAVITAMIERAEQPNRTPTAAAPHAAASSAAAPKPAPPSPCEGVELLGLHKEDFRPVSPLILYFAKVRNGTTMTKIVNVEWTNLYGERIRNTAEVGAGQIATLQLAAQQPIERMPVDLRIGTCR